MRALSKLQLLVMRLSVLLVLLVSLAESPALFLIQAIRAILNLAIFWLRHAPTPVGRHCL
jgi:hypothetical protein